MLRFFKYRFKILISQKIVMFWALAFPIILASFFNLSLANLDASNLFKTMDVAVVGNKDAEVVKLMDKVKFNQEKSFNLLYLDNEKALKKLEDKKVAGLIKIDDKGEFDLTIIENDTDQMLLQEFLNSYSQNHAMINEVIKDNPNILQSDWLKNLDFYQNHIEALEVSEKTNNQMIISFYSVIAMACLYGSMLSIQSAYTIEPDLSAQGARLQVSPYSKYKLVLVDFISAIIILSFNLIVLIVYMNYVLKVDFSNQIVELLIICLVGGCFSVSFGYMASLIFKGNESFKGNIIAAATMFWSFLAGMMSPAIKYSVESVVPFIKFFNPVALITDSFFTIYYYGDFMKILPYLGTLILMFLICTIISINILRRQQYDSI